MTSPWLEDDGFDRPKRVDRISDVDETDAGLDAPCKPSNAVVQILPKEGGLDEHLRSPLHVQGQPERDTALNPKPETRPRPEP